MKTKLIHDNISQLEMIFERKKTTTTKKKNTHNNSGYNSWSRQFTTKSCCIT